ncbi:MAG TPA: saccharopine dehydrogenase NADP-binding domain-containing protein [Thermoleophilaceae bacterium]|jgi:short subunit dehydrogenase-like uncharacterized protein
MAAEGRELDLVLYGATGFVGKLTADYLARSAASDVRIGLAGRSQEKLQRLRSGLGERAADWPLIVADSGDRDALGAMAKRTTAIATTVGPYRKYGLKLVDACATEGTHYADLTGEILFIHDTIRMFDAPARESGARIVHSCGFDSIPFDLGVLVLHEAAGELLDTNTVVTRIRGGISGGTADAMKGMVDDARADPALREVTDDPYALSPDREAEPDLGDERDRMRIERDDELGGWLAPFLEARTNTRVIRRTNALLGYAYGRRFKYRELMGTGRGVVGQAKAAGVVAGLAGLEGSLAARPTRFVLDRVLPDPGEGPSDKMVREGFFELEIHARAADGGRWLARVGAKGDPGYGATCVMLGEAGLCLALDGEKLPERTGVLTPATGLGRPLVERLRAAGQRFEAAAA